MKRSIAFFAASLVFLASLAFLASCGTGGGGPGGGYPGHSGDSSDPIPVAEGAWADCSLSAKVVSGAATDQLYFSTNVSTPGDYVVEFRDMSPATRTEDFLWLVDAEHFFGSLASGQEAADYYSISSPGRCVFLVRNDSPTASMACQVRLVLLSGSGFFIPNEGGVLAPVPLTLGVAHAGKVGRTGIDDMFGTSYYSFATGEAGAYTIAAPVSDPAGMASLWIDLYDPSGEQVNFGGLPSSPNLLAGTTYSLEISTFGGGAARPTYSLTVSAP